MSGFQKVNRNFNLKRQVKSFICLVAVISWIGSASVAFAQGFQSMTGAKMDTAVVEKDLGKTFLTGGIAHSEELPAVEKAFRSGHKYNLDEMEAVLDKGRKTVKGEVSEATVQKLALDPWFRLPKDLNGVFYTDYYFVLYAKELQTGQEDLRTHKEYAKYLQNFGTVKDSKGEIWTHFKDVWKTKVDSPSEFAHQFYTVDRLAHSDKGSFSQYQQWRSSTVNKRTQKIVKTSQLEAISTKYLIGPATLREDISMKEFDQFGKPTYVSKIVRISKQRSAFDSMPSKADLESFKMFLQEKGWMDLYPVQDK